jgi:hypothetical protein
MLIKTSRKVIILLLWLLSSLPSQPGEYRLNLYKDNLSWYWSGKIYWNSGWHSGSQFLFDDQFSSNLFLERALGNKWRDENNLAASWTHRLQESWKTASHLKSQIFSDENSFVKFSKHLLYQEVQYSPNPKISLLPALGWTTEDIYRYRDQGWYSQLGMKIRHYDMGGYFNTTDGFSLFYFFPNRKNQEHRYFLSFNKQFSEQASDSIQVGYECVDNIYPLPPTNGTDMKILEDVGINAHYLYNDLHYNLSQLTIFQIETKLQNRDVTQSNPNLLNHRRELNYANRMGIRYAGPRMSAAFAFNSSQITTLSSRRPTGSDESRTDIDGLQAAFNMMWGWKMSTADEVLLTLSYTKYQYSSPDTTQSIDEDDIRFIIDLHYQHRFSPFFLFKLNTNLYFYHQIYIFPSRSANNNWNRIYQLAPSFVHKISDRFENIYQLKILANYTVYDFEEILPEVRSYLFRKLIFADTLKVRLSGGLKIQTFYQLEKEDNGTFFKDIFAQQISRELLSHYLDIALVYYRINGLEISTALNWYIRKEWSLVPERRLVRDYLAFSPRLSIVYNFGRKLYLYATLSPRVYQDINIKEQYFSTGRINLKYIF